MVNLEYAIRLMKIALESGDEKLINMAKELVDSLREEEKIPAVEPVAKKEPTDSNNDFIFQMKNQSDKEQRNAIPVNSVKNRVNQFVDDGEDRDITTPDIKLAERKRKPFQKIQQICTKCGTKVDVHPSHKREFYVCDRCIKR